MSDIKGKFFYRIKKNNIKLINDFSDLKVYGEDTIECSICMEEGDLIIFVPCGHYCCCKGCSATLKTCCLCRAPIQQCITKDQLQ